MAGTLYLCATPIGNLEDMTFRVIRTLKEVDLIAAEDTRNSIKLLNHFEIKTPMTSYHEYNKIEKGHALVEKLLTGMNIALITDAGTPGISDPGECVLVIEGKSRESILQEERAKWEEMTVQEHMDYYMNQGIDKKEAMKKVAKDRGVGKRDIYKELL